MCSWTVMHKHIPSKHVRASTVGIWWVTVGQCGQGPTYSHPTCAPCGLAHAWPVTVLPFVAHGSL